AYSPSGYVGDLPGGRETRGQNEGKDLGLGKPCGGIDQALLDGAGAHGLYIQAPSVVTYANEYVGAGVPGRQVNSSSGRFPGSAAGFRRLDTVIHAVA